MNKKVEIKIIRNDNKEFLIDGTEWGITKLDGFNGVDNIIYSEDKCVGDGSTFSGERVGDKDRTISVRLKNKNLNEIMRKVVISFFNPKYTYKVYVTYQGRTLWCQGRQIGFSCDMINVYQPIIFTWTILSNMPYMMSVDNFGKNIASIIPMCGFPFVSILNKGFNVSVFNFAKQVLIENDGDIGTFIQCVISAKGNVENPKLIKDGKYVRIIDNMVANDIYVIDFAANPPTVKKNGINAISKTDRTSNFVDMDLLVGDNTISFDADNGSNNMEVILYYNKRYLGL